MYGRTRSFKRSKALGKRRGKRRISLATNTIRGRERVRWTSPTIGKIGRGDRGRMVV